MDKQVNLLVAIIFLVLIVNNPLVIAQESEIRTEPDRKGN